MYTHAHTPPRLRWPADFYRFQNISGHVEYQRLPKLLRSRQLLESHVQHRTFSDFNDGVRFPVHELIAFIASG
jgi:hypothetical protein